MPDIVTNDGKYSGHLELIRCENVQGQLRKRGEPFQLTLKEAADKFSPGQPANRAIVIRAHRGQYIGLRLKGKSKEGFVIANNNEDGDISWLLKKIPELESSIQEIYLVLDREMPRMVIRPEQGATP